LQPPALVRITTPLERWHDRGGQEQAMKMMNGDRDAHARGHPLVVAVGLGLLLAAAVAGALWLLAGRSELVERPPEPDPEAVAQAPAGAPGVPAPPVRAQPPRFFRAPREVKPFGPALGKETPFDPQELLPPERFRRSSRRVRDARLNALIAEANLDSSQTQKLLEFTESTNKQVDQAYNEIVLPRIPSTDPAAREQARVAFLRSLTALTRSYDGLLAELGPRAQNAARSMGLDLTNLLTPEQGYQLRSFLKRFGSKQEMDPPATAPATNM
jgi:hypothetical protein